MSTRPPVISGFSFVRPLGSGGFAEVFLYEQDMPRRHVAVKVLNADLASDEARFAFVAEADAMARLSSHPSIVSVYAASVSADGKPYLAMEFCPDSMRERSRGRAVPLHEVLDAGVRLAGALETAHGAGVLHRDIKPGNVLVATTGRPALTDFGIAALGTALARRPDAAHETAGAGALRGAASGADRPAPRTAETSRAAEAPRAPHAAADPAASVAPGASVAPTASVVPGASPAPTASAARDAPAGSDAPGRRGARRAARGFDASEFASPTRPGGGQAMSIPWSAPELIAGESSGDVASEVWSLGATLYTFAAGRSPFESDDRQQNTRAKMSARIRRAKYTPVAGALGYEAFDRVMAQAMHREPRSRFASMLDFGRALQALQREYGYDVTPLEVTRSEWIPEAPDPSAPRGPAVPQGPAPGSRAALRAAAAEDRGASGATDRDGLLHDRPSPLRAGLIGAAAALLATIGVAAVIMWIGGGS